MLPDLLSKAPVQTVARVHAAMLQLSWALRARTWKSTACVQQLLPLQPASSTCTVTN